MVGHEFIDLLRGRRTGAVVRGDECFIDSDLAAYVEGAFDEGRRVAIEEHLADCSRCTELVQQLRASQHVLRSLRREFVEPEQLEAIRAGVLRELSTKEPPRRQWLAWIFGGRRAWRYASLASLFALAAGSVVWWMPLAPRPRQEIAREAPLWDLPAAPGDSAGRSARGTRSGAEPGAARMPDDSSLVRDGRPESGGISASPPNVAALTIASATRTTKRTTATHDPRPASPQPGGTGEGERTLSVEEAVIHPSSDPEGLGPDSVRLRLATSDPDIVLYWLVDTNGG